MYRLKIAGMDQVSFGPVPVLMAVKIIWSTDYNLENSTCAPLKYTMGSPILIVSIYIWEIHQRIKCDKYQN